MFCPKCGTDNPDTGRFCRACGTAIGGVSDVIAAQSAAAAPVLDKRGKRVSLEGAITKLFMGVAFIAVSLALGLSGSGKNWWFWMLIPAFAMIGTGVAQIIQLKHAMKGGVRFAESERLLEPRAATPGLPPSQTAYVPAESRYKTGDLVPPSVTEDTTRHLDSSSEGETMTLPKV
ncbi:MAG: zinc-ribbon domain-containing protein [Pyrinomonadaceae bacterium]